MELSRASLLRWYRRHRRTLPWREKPEPYRIWISELMLQQTQVKTVVPYFERFVSRFPDVHSLAKASEQDVLAAWSGLGYYGRARALHRAAKMLVHDHGGVLPADVGGWLALPGIGRYTAGAIVSIAFDKKAAILDGNVARVLSRYFGVTGDIQSSGTRRILWRLSEEILPDRSVGEFNQALMELGALICTKSAPRCLACPLRQRCVARRDGRERELPETRARPRPVRVNAGAALVSKGDRFLVFQRLQGGLMRDLWEFPTGECSPDEAPRAAIAREARERYGIHIDIGEELARVRHSIMNRRIVLHAFSASLRGRVPSPHRWASEAQLSDLPVSSIVQKILRAVRAVEGSGKKRVAPPVPPALF